MPIKTILNRIQKYRGFVYGPMRLHGQGATLRLEVEIYPHLRNGPRCAGCGRRGHQYDTLAPRWFEFVPLWGVRVFFLYRMRRVACVTCDHVRVEQVPWAAGKHQLTTTYAWFLARWAKRLSWREVAATFRTSWDSVYHAVALAVAWGRAHQNLTGIAAVGIDQIQWQHGHRYLTLVYQIDPGRTRLLWIGQQRRVKTLLRFFRWFGPERTQALRFVCSDMWQPYLKVIAKKAGHALHILDRFHIALNMNKATDSVRRAEVRELKQRGRPAWLTKTRWLLLRRRANRTDADHGRLRDLLRLNLKAVRCMLLREDFEPFWRYRSAYWAGVFLDRWCTRVMPVAHRADEEGCPHAAPAPRLVVELVQGPWADLRGRRRGVKQQGQTDYQKGVWVSDLPMSRNRAVPHARSPAGTRHRPQILLRSQQDQGDET